MVSARVGAPKARSFFSIKFRDEIRYVILIFSTTVRIKISCVSDFQVGQRLLL